MHRPYLLLILALAVLLFQAHRHAREIDALKEDRTVEFAAAVAEGVARTLKPAPPVCVEYLVAMERILITHCMNREVKL